MKNYYRTLIVDDERLARTKLTGILGKFENFVIVGEADDVPSAKKQIEALKPDLIFLDIQMPRETGFDLLEQIDFEGIIVFVTAYDEYALRAFEVNALDYLLKPVKEEMVEKLIAKLQKKSPKKEEQYTKLEYTDRLFVSNDKQMKFIDIRSIIMIQSVGNYSKLFFENGEKIMVYKPMKEWDARLPQNKFCRIHRTSIVNIDFIEKIDRWFNYSYRVFLTGIDEPLRMSKSYSSVLRERFS